MRPQRTQRKKKRVYAQKKTCRFCAEKRGIDFKDIKTLRSLTTDLGKIIPRRISGNCAKHQRVVTTAINRSRSIALLPFSAER